MSASWGEEGSTSFGRPTVHTRKINKILSFRWGLPSKPDVRRGGESLVFGQGEGEVKIPQICADILYGRALTIRERLGQAGLAGGSYRFAN